MDIISCYDAGAVTRFHTVRTIQNQTVGCHSWGVAMVIMYICEPSAALLKAAMLHDVPELMTGDVPAPFKWAFSEAAKHFGEAEDEIIASLGIHVELTDEERTILRWADMMELVMYSVSEVRMGNRIMGDVFHRGMRYLTEKLTAPTVKAEKLLQAFRKETKV